MNFEYLASNMYNKPLDQSFITESVNKFIKSGKQEIVFICVGTDKCIGDAVGPLVGTKLSSKDITIYGTLHDPIHALTIDDKLEEIHEKHPDAFFIGIDACLGDEEDIGLIFLRNFGVRPGRGVGKDLPGVGSISIMALVDSSENSEFFFSRSIRLSFIMDMADKIAKTVQEIDSAVTEYLCVQEAAMTNLEDKEMKIIYGGINHEDEKEF